MRHLIFLLPFLVCVTLSPSVPADPISTPSPFPVEDYIPGIYGEPLGIGDVELTAKGTLRITSELRYGNYNWYLDSSGAKRELEPYDYSRLAYFLEMDIGLTEHVEIGLRVPFIWRKLQGPRPVGKLDNKRFGDLLLRLRANPFGSSAGPIGISLGAGIKLPTGDHRLRSDYHINEAYYVYYSGDVLPTRYLNPYEDLPTGTGSTDLAFMAYLAYDNSDLRSLKIYANFGYVVTGKTEAAYRHYYTYEIGFGDLYLGDVYSYDIALVRAFSPSISGVLEFNGYSITASKSEEGWKTDGGEHRFEVSPGIAISISRFNLNIEGGFSWGLFGANALQGTIPFLRVKTSTKLRS